MADPTWVAAAKVLISPFTKLAALAYESFRRPTINLSKAPDNLFEHIRPGVSTSRVRDLLGEPHRATNGRYCYTFSDACVQIDSKDQATVDAVSVGLSKLGWRRDFHIWPMHNLVLGKTPFRDVVEPDAKIYFEWSSKEYHFWVVNYYGFPGLYCSYALGVLECPGVHNSGPHWSPDKEPRDEIPSELKINWACVTRLDEAPAFNYYGFL
jgi:hypothetical protein